MAMDVQATLLYRSIRPVDFDALATSVNAWLGTEDMAMHHCPSAGDTFVLMSNPRYHAVINIEHEKIAAAEILTALSAPNLQSKNFDYADALQAHRLQVKISIGDGPMHVASDVREWMDKMGKHQEAPTCPKDLKLCALNGLVQQFLAHDVPELVYWAQSDTIFTPEEVSEASDMLFPLPLIITPVTVAGKSGTVPGVIMQNSSLLTGRTLMVEAGTLPTPEATGIAMWLLSKSMKGQLSLDHGVALETPGFPALYLRHEQPDEMDKHGRIVITGTQPVALDTRPQMELSPISVAKPASDVSQAEILAPAKPAERPFFTSVRMETAPAYVPTQPAVAAERTAAPSLVANSEPTPAQHTPMSAENALQALHKQAKAMEEQAKAEAEAAQAAEAQQIEEQQAEAVEQQPQTDPTEVQAAPTPPPVTAKGWANAAKRANPFDLAAAAAANSPAAQKNTTTSQAKKSGEISNNLPSHHKDLDVAQVFLAAAANSQPKEKFSVRAALRKLPVPGSAKSA